MAHTEISPGWYQNDATGQVVSSPSGNPDNVLDRPTADGRYLPPVTIAAPAMQIMSGVAAKAGANAGSVPAVSLPNAAGYFAATFIVPPKWATFDVEIRYCNSDATAAGTARLWRGVKDFAPGEEMTTAGDSWTPYFNVSGTEDLVEQTTIVTGAIATPGNLVTVFAGREVDQGTYAGAFQVLAIIATPTSVVAD